MFDAAISSIKVSPISPCTQPTIPLVVCFMKSKVYALTHLNPLRLLSLQDFVSFKNDADPTYLSAVWRQVCTVQFLLPMKICSDPKPVVGYLASTQILTCLIVVNYLFITRICMWKYWIVVNVYKWCSIICKLQSLLMEFFVCFLFFCRCVFWTSGNDELFQSTDEWILLMFSHHHLFLSLLRPKIGIHPSPALAW